MNAKTKRRMVVVTGIIVIVLVVILAVVGGTSSAKTVSVAEAATGSYADQKIQVSGNVVENSFATEGNVLTFDIYDPNGDITQQLRVRFEGGVSATFGNDVTAICTGKVGEDGVLNASELVTKCPSKIRERHERVDGFPVDGIRRRGRRQAGEGGRRGEGRHAEGGGRGRPVRARRSRERRRACRRVQRRDLGGSEGWLFARPDRIHERAGQVLRNRSGPRRLDRFLQTKGGRIAAPKG